MRSWSLGETSLLEELQIKVLRKRVEPASEAERGP
jgi:hypothetical protein